MHIPRADDDDNDDDYITMTMTVTKLMILLTWYVASNNVILLYIDYDLNAIVQ